MQDHRFPTLGTIVPKIDDRTRRRIAKARAAVRVRDLLAARDGGCSNTVSKHIEVLRDALPQLPYGYRRRILIRLDGAGARYGLIEHLLSPSTTRGRVPFTSDAHTGTFIAGLLCGLEPRTATVRGPATAPDSGTLRAFLKERKR